MLLKETFTIFLKPSHKAFCIHPFSEDNFRKIPFSVYYQQHLSPMDTSLLSPLTEKLLSGDISIALQPIRRLAADMQTRPPVGYEALLRMSDDDGHAIPPDQCLPTLEHALGRPTVERRIIEIALARIAGYDRTVATDPLPYYSLNISPSTLMTEGTVAWLADTIRSASLDPRRIVCELLETEPLGDIHTLSRVLRKAHTEGLRIVLDDCTDTDGDHHTIATIRQVLDTIDGIKMDKSFAVSLLRVAQEQGEEHAGRYLLDILDRLRAV